MVNKQLDILMEFLSKADPIKPKLDIPAATGSLTAKDHKWNQAQSDDINHSSHVLATNNKYPGAEVIDTKVGPNEPKPDLPAAGERVYFSTAEPPTNYKGKIYVGEKGANFWTPTANELKESNTEASDMIGKYFKDEEVKEMRFTLLGGKKEIKKINGVWYKKGSKTIGWQKATESKSKK